MKATFPDESGPRSVRIAVLCAGLFLASFSHGKIWHVSGVGHNWITWITDPVSGAGSLKKDTDLLLNISSVNTCAGATAMDTGAPQLATSHEPSADSSDPAMTETFFIDGDLRPGASPAEITFDGDVIFGSFSSLEIEIGGTSPGSEHDKLVIAGAAFLDGTLNVVLIDDFVPQRGDSFEMLAAASVTGAFSGVHLPTIPLLPWVVTYGPTFVRLAVAIPPDLDIDGDVDSDDSTMLSSCASGPGIPHNGTLVCQEADLDDDRDVDQADFAILQRCLSGAGIPVEPGCPG